MGEEAMPVVTSAAELAIKDVCPRELTVFALAQTRLAFQYGKPVWMATKMVGWYSCLRIVNGWCTHGYALLVLSAIDSRNWQAIRPLTKDWRWWDWRLFSFAFHMFIHPPCVGRNFIIDPTRKGEKHCLSLILVLLDTRPATRSHRVLGCWSFFADEITMLHSLSVPQRILTVQCTKDGRWIISFRFILCGIGTKTNKQCGSEYFQPRGFHQYSLHQKRNPGQLQTLTPSISRTTCESV